MKKCHFLTFLLLLIAYHLLNDQIYAAFRYPIRELGRCRDTRECRLYCSVPQNIPACWSYARFGPQNNVLGDTSTALTFPIAELGNCSSVIDCRAFCRKAENRDSCTNFALKKKLIKTKVKQISSIVLNNARKELGCDSPTSCHNYCRKAENRQICQAFGEKHNLIKKKTALPVSFTPAPGGCKTEKECRQYCLAHPDECPYFPKKTSSFSGLLAE